MSQINQPSQPETIEPTPHFSLDLLGPPSIHLNNQPIQITSQKALAILFYVACANGSVPRSTLIGLLWPDSSENSARSNFRTQLGLLRKATGDCLAISRTEIALSQSADIHIDVKQLLQDNERASLSELEQRLGLWRGEFLTGFEVSGSAEFDWWLTETREHLRHQIIKVAERVVYLAESEQNNDLQLKAARRWVTLSPLQEAAHRAVMLAYQAAGNRSEAIKQSKICEQLLSSELGVAPSFETKLVIDQLLEEPLGKSAENDSSSFLVRERFQEQPPFAELRRLLLDKTKKFWIDSVLRRHAPAESLIKLRWEPQPELVEHPWEDVVGELVLTHGWRESASTQTVETVFSLAGQSLLITGEPGAGKTIMLLQLAEILHRHALSSAAEPIPLVLNLSSWANQKLPIEQWAVAELQNKYAIPADVGKSWLADERFTYLLDGLDEMPINVRPQVILAINQWVEQTQPAGVLVCCRQNDYLATGERLKLLGAVRLLPLTIEQIKSHIGQNEDQNELLQMADTIDSESQEKLFELAASPMMLNMIQQVNVSNIGGRNFGTLSELIGRYVSDSFRRKPLKPEQEDAISRKLTWLAQKMLIHNQTILLLEDLQPSWLDSKKNRFIYMLATRLLTGMLGSIEYSLFGLVLLVIAPNSELELVKQIGNLTQLPYFFANGLTFLLICSVVGLVGGFIDFVNWERQRPTNRSTRDRLQKAILAAVLAALPIALFGNWIIAGIYALLFGSSTFVAGLTWLTGTGYANDIHADEALGWSWVQAGWGALFGLGLSGVVITFFATEQRLVSFFVIVVTMVLLFGMKGKRLTAAARPNQGMLTTLNNGLIGGGIASAALFAAVALVAGWQNGLLVAGLVGLSILLTQGVFVVLRHGMLRLLLRYSAGFPLAGANYLDDVCRYSVLQKVGGGYVFRHRLILDYFAESADGE